MSGDAVRYAPELLLRIAALCEADPEREACGFVVRRAPGATLEVIAIPNAADRFHAADPATFPRTGREAYVMDPEAQLRALRELDATGGAVVAVWHSHVDVGAWLSAKDRADAVVDGVPLMPGAEYIVLGLRGGKVTEARRYRRDGAEFVEAAIE